MDQKELKYDGAFLKLYEWKQELKGGGISTFERVVRRPVVSIIGIQGDKVCLIREFRYEKNDVVEKFPAGFVEDGEAIEDTALREFREEAGYTAGKMTLLDSTSARSTFDFPEHVFLAENLSEDPLPSDEGEEIVEVKMVPMEEIYHRIVNDKFYFSFTSFTFLKWYLQNRTER